ncbi:hypothetical protein BJ322DRAFT_1167005 [Thelephora terrestris]|uniref:Uncharacterized protein n=1 Tax=Thelephora terrestris TaxID=56493 RepID=A0A9P6H5D5_9AGAM|nr:hypothetical protein BJ322DRAFT_1167005 [Thelephora terrestris]
MLPSRVFMLRAAAWVRVSLSSRHPPLSLTLIFFVIKNPFADLVGLGQYCSSILREAVSQIERFQGESEGDEAIVISILLKLVSSIEIDIQLAGFSSEKSEGFTLKTQPGCDAKSWKVRCSLEGWPIGARVRRLFVGDDKSSSNPNDIQRLPTMYDPEPSCGPVTKSTLEVLIAFQSVGIRTPTSTVSMFTVKRNRENVPERIEVGNLPHVGFLNHRMEGSVNSQRKTNASTDKSKAIFKHIRIPVRVVTVGIISRPHFGYTG